MKISSMGTRRNVVLARDDGAIKGIVSEQPHAEAAWRGERLRGRCGRGRRCRGFLPRSSEPCSDFLSHLPACMVALARGTERAIAIMRPRVSSATATALAPGVFITTMPRRVAASASMLSTPTPARPMMRSFGRGFRSWRRPARRSGRRGRRHRRGLRGRPRHLVGGDDCQPGSYLKMARVAGETFLRGRSSRVLLSEQGTGCRVEGTGLKGRSTEHRLQARRPSGQRT